jgi:hypothetical protein
LLQSAGVPHRDADANAGVAARDRSDQAAGKHVAGARQQPYGHNPRYATRAGEFRPAAIQFQHGTAYMYQESVARGSQYHPMTLALEEFDTHVLLEQSQLPGHSGLDQVE